MNKRVGKMSMPYIHSVCKNMSFCHHALYFVVVVFNIFACAKADGHTLGYIWAHLVIWVVISVHYFFGYRCNARKQQQVMCQEI